jgi:Domain of unknown function (DUF4397)
MQRTPEHARRGRTALRAVSLALAAALTIATYALVAAVPVSGQTGMARIRMAHLSNGTAPADVYLTSFDGQQKRVLQGLAYGQVSQYLDLAPGAYTAVLRPAGASPDSPAMLTAATNLSAGDAYTFAVFGPHTHPAPKILDDRIAAPPAGAGRVRVVQAATRAAHADVVAVGGAALAHNVSFGSVTDYADVPAGSWTINATGPGHPMVSKQLKVDPGTVDSLIVFDAPDTNGIDIESVVDATGMSALSVAGQSVPAGGVQTGAGGLAPPPPSGAPPWLVIVLVGALLAAAATSAAALVHRRHVSAFPVPR